MHTPPQDVVHLHAPIGHGRRQQYPRLQLRTVKDLLDGRGIERPSTAASLDETFKQGPRGQGGRQARGAGDLIRASLLEPLGRRRELASREVITGYL